MTHLSPDQIVDVMEGCAGDTAAAHAAGCATCRAKIEALLAAVRLAESDPLPEPSPLFWPRLAARIGEAVRRDGGRLPSWRSWGWRLAPAGAMAILVIAVGIGSRVWTGMPGSAALVPEAPADAPATLDAVADVEPAEDPSWLLVSELSAEVSVEDAEASGALPPPGGTDRALLQLDAAERAALARILREEIGTRAPVMPQGPGA